MHVGLRFHCPPSQQAQPPTHAQHNRPLTPNTSPTLVSATHTPPQIVQGLGYSAQASVHAGLGRLRFRQVDQFSTAHPHVSFLPPELTFTDHDHINVEGLLARIVASHTADEAVGHGALVIVAHRETIRTLTAIHQRIPYCGTLRLHAQPAPSPAGIALTCLHASFPLRGHKQAPHAAGVPEP
jgi:hypothetical protein